MKRLSLVSIALPLLFLFPTGAAMSQIFGPAECALTLDPDHCCDRAADEATRVETARSILKVNARPDPGQPDGLDVDHYYKVINYWAVNGSGEDGEGEDGAVYQETTLSNLTRQEMWEYLNVVFGWSSDMELVTYDELWETHPDGSMTYMVVNRWFGSTMGGYYEQPGISIVKFRPGEGCASYQRDYFSEGDTWWSMSFSQDMVRAKRETVITELGLTARCVDDDGDGYTKYLAAAGCPNEGLDCDDYHPDVNPGGRKSQETDSMMIAIRRHRTLRSGALQLPSSTHNTRSPRILRIVSSFLACPSGLCCCCGDGNAGDRTIIWRNGKRGGVALRVSDRPGRAHVYTEDTACLDRRSGAFMHVSDRTRILASRSLRGCRLRRAWNLRARHLRV